MEVKPKTPAEIIIMEEGGHKLGFILKQIKHWLEPGQSLLQIEQKIAELIKKAKCEPAFLNYHGFPATSCLSVNETVVHGIPSSRVIKTGDILSVDTGLIFKGFNLDTAFTFPIGKISQEAQTLLDVTREALRVGIQAAISGNYSTDIGKEIENYVDSQGKFGIVRDLVGHGIGRKLQEPPEIPNFRSRGGIKLENNMTICIEPMINLGSYEVSMLDDGWTVISADQSLSAHFESTLAILNNDPIILTPLPD